MRLFAAVLLTALTSALAGTAAAETPVLKVYTYESFTAEWGPGPAGEEGLRGRMRLHGRVHLGRGRRRAAVAAEAGGQVEPGGCGAGPRHQPDRRGDGDRAVRAAWPDARRPVAAGGLDRPGLRALRLELLRLRLRQDQGAEPAQEPARPGREQRPGADHPGPAHQHAGPRPAALGQAGLRRQGAGGLGQAEAAHPHRHPGLERELRPVPQGRGADDLQLHHLAALSRDRRERQ